MTLLLGGKVFIESGCVSRHKQQHETMKRKENGRSCCTTAARYRLMDALKKGSAYLLVLLFHEDEYSYVPPLRR
jgi:muramidase (phage lysozyme)